MLWERKLPGYLLFHDPPAAYLTGFAVEAKRFRTRP